MSFICSGGIDWLKSILQKDMSYYFKYREFLGIFTINDNISDNSIQLNIKFILSLVETAYPIVNMIKVINKKARTT